MGRRPAVNDAIPENSIIANETNEEIAGETQQPLTSAQRLAASSPSLAEVAPDPFGREAKHFTETRVLNREVYSFQSQNMKFHIWFSF